MNRKIKTILTFMVMMCCLCSIPVCASEVQNKMEARLNNIVNVYAELDISGSTAQADVTVRGATGTTKITGSIKLMQIDSNGNETGIKTWSNLSSSSEILEVSKSCSVTKGYSYRLDVTMAVKCNNRSETVKFSSDEVECR